MRYAAVVGLPRCASTLVCEGLAQHRDILGFGEIFSESPSARLHFHSLGSGDTHVYNRETGRVNEYMEYLFALARHLQRDCVTFKLLDYQDRKAWKYLEQNPQIELIYCRRDNPLEALVSVTSAFATNVWHARTLHDVPVSPVVEIDPEKAKQWFERQESFHDRLASLANLKHEVRYSAVMENVPRVMRRLFAILGVTELPVETPQVKIAHGELRDRVSNYSALKARFGGTKWGTYFP